MPRLDKKTWKVIEERYKEGESVYSLAKEYGVSHTAILQHMKRKGITKKSDSVNNKKEIEQIPEKIKVTKEEAEEVKEAVKEELSKLDQEMAEIDAVRSRIYEQIGINEPMAPSMYGATNDLQSLLWELERRKKEYERMKRKLMEMVGISSSTGTLNAQGILSLKEQLDNTVEEAKKVLEEMGYKVVPAGTPTSLEEAKKILQEAGYEVKSTLYTKEDIEKIREEVRKEIEEKYKREIDKQMQDKRVDGVVQIVEHVVDRIFELFAPTIKPKVTETIEKTAEKKKEVKEVINLLRNKVKSSMKGEGENGNQGE